MIKVLLVDDQKILLDGLRAILETDTDIKVVDIATEGKKAVEVAGQLKPDVILMDIRMPEMNGVECTRIIKSKWPHIAVLMLTTFDDEEYIIDALKYGACGYLLKDINGQSLIQAVKDASRGDTILPSKVAARLAGRVSSRSDEPGEKLKKTLGLSEREVEIAKMISQGFSNRQIASALFISEGTVKNYTSSVYSKLEVSDRTAAAIKIRQFME